MTGFVTVAALMLLLAASFAIVPFLPRSRLPFFKSRSERQTDSTFGDPSREEANVNVYIAQRVQWRSDLSLGRIDAEDAVQLERESQALLVDDLHGEQDAAPDNGKLSKTLIASLTVAALITVPAALYVHLGAANKVFATQQATAPEVGMLGRGTTGQPGTLMVSSLINAGNQAMRAKNFPAAESAYRSAAKIRPVEGGVALVLAMYSADGNHITARVRREIDAVLKLNPHQPFLLQMLAGHAAREGAYGVAASHLAEILVALPPSPRRDRIVARMNRFKKLQEPEQAKIQSSNIHDEPVSRDGKQAVTQESTVDKAPGFQIKLTATNGVLKSFPPETLVFVIARPPGQRMPLAVARLTLADLPTTVRLDDRNVMRTGTKLKDAGALELVARTALKGMATRHEDDIEAISQGTYIAGSPMPVVALDLSAR